MTRLAPFAVALCRQVAVVLAAVGLFGMVHGEAGIGGPSGLLTRGAQASAGSTPALPAINYTPTPQPGLSRALAPGESWKAPPVAAIHALALVAPERERDAVRIAFCESGWDTEAIGAAGEQGAWQVLARFHGPVGQTLAQQAAQFDRIAAEHGIVPWTTKDGCEQWRR